MVKCKPTVVLYSMCCTLGPGATPGPGTSMVSDSCTINDSGPVDATLQKAASSSRQSLKQAGSHGPNVDTWCAAAGLGQQWKICVCSHLVRRAGVGATMPLCVKLSCSNCMLRRLVSDMALWPSVVHHCKAILQHHFMAKGPCGARDPERRDPPS